MLDMSLHHTHISCAFEIYVEFVLIINIEIFEWLICFSPHACMNGFIENML